MLVPPLRHWEVREDARGEEHLHMHIWGEGEWSWEVQLDPQVPGGWIEGRDLASRGGERETQREPQRALGGVRQNSKVCLREGADAGAGQEIELEKQVDHAEALQQGEESREVLLRTAGQSP